MKKLLIGIMALGALSAYANLPQDVQQFVGQEGQLSSVVNGEPSFVDGENCFIGEDPYGGDSRILFDNSRVESILDFEGADVSRRGNTTTYELTESGKRPGGSVCGDWDKLIHFKKTVTVENNEITVKEVFRCLLDGKTVRVETCKM